MARKDPVIAAKFEAKFGSKLSGVFRECTVVSAETEPAEYKAAENGSFVYYAVPGRLKWGRITLKRGLTDDNQAWTWRKEVEDGNIQSARTNGTITMSDQDGTTAVAVYDFINAWPLKVSGPAPNANSSDIAMEELEIIAERILKSK